MDIRNQLSSALGRRDEEPNILLAEQIVSANDGDAISQLAALFEEGTQKEQKDAIKVLYEVGARKPEMIAGLHTLFFELLTSKVSRLVWGAMTALDAIRMVVPEILVERHEELFLAGQRGSVIAADKMINIVTHLASDARYRDLLLPKIFNVLRAAPINQFATYVEKTQATIEARDALMLCDIINRRIEIDPMPESKIKRLKKSLNHLMDLGQKSD